MAQTDSYMLWAEVGAEGKIVKRTKWNAQLNARIGERGIETFFPQVGVEYKLMKWLRPSVEYRFIVDKNKYNNYKVGHRINANIEAKHNIKRLEYGMRVRYQYSFNRVAQSTYNADFDQAIRFKPFLEYDINNSIFTPAISAEFFLNPSYGPSSPGFDKIRFAVGSKLELDGPHSVSFKYQLDKWLNNYNKGLRHVLSLSYGYKF